MGTGTSVPETPAWDAETVDAAEWPGLESMLCEQCGASSTRLLRCGSCRGAFYCGQACQRAAWAKHREVCGSRGRPVERPPAPGSPASSAPGTPRAPGAAADALRQGVVAFRGQKYREALSKANEALTIATEEGLAGQRFNALMLKGQCFEQLSEFPKAKTAFAEALVEARAMAQGTEATHAEATVLLRLGAVAARTSRPGIAVQYQRKAVALLKADGQDKDALAAAYNNLAISAWRHGQEESARSAFEQAFALRKETGHIEGLCACSTNMANMLREQDKTEEAVSLLEEALRLAHDAESSRMERQVLLNLANLYENEFAAPATRGPAPEAEEGPPAAQLAEPVTHGAVAPGATEPEGAADLGAAEPEGATEARAADVPGDEEVPQAPRAPRTRASAARHALRCRRRLFGLPPACEAPSALELVCGHCGTSLQGREKQLRCSRCRGRFYCGAACQREDWNSHSARCQPSPQPSAAEVELQEHTCPICFEGLQLLSPTPADLEVILLPCLHCLHSSCWRQVTQNGGSGCPVCRDNLAYATLV